ncbi:hypothetical protein ACRYCC_33130 [Actinomadura scrupuli]|uniref:hypothetical protein n=1 Tax=Actinomadura scrupuli TaxID=559629 RepID=UPI003D979188
MTRESKAGPPSRARGAAGKDDTADKGDDTAQQPAAAEEAAEPALSHQELERLRARLARKYH